MDLDKEKNELAASFLSVAQPKVVQDSVTPQEMRFSPLPIAIKKNDSVASSFSSCSTVQQHTAHFSSASSYKKNTLPKLSLEEKSITKGRFPAWLHRSMPKGDTLTKTEQSIFDNRLYTVCEEAKCPNLLECYSKKTATFLLLGKECTRACGFCSIHHAKTPPLPDIHEPQRVAQSALELGLQHIVLTMVARDDLPDGGARHVVQTIQQIRENIKNATCEVLVSDFKGNVKALDTLLQENPEVFNHNIETVARLTPRVRHTATYERSLDVLSYMWRSRSHTNNMLIKSGIMLGLGETEEEVFSTLADLKKVGVDIITMGQYLQSHWNKLSVKEFITPQQFEKYKAFATSIGVATVYAGPFVRSSYNAKLFVRHAVTQQQMIVESS